MPAIWQVEFDRDAARDLKKLGADAQRQILNICLVALRHRPIGAVSVTRSPAISRAFGAIASGIFASSRP